MQGNDCYLTEEQKDILRQIAQWLRDERTPVEWRLVKHRHKFSLVNPIEPTDKEVDVFLNSLQEADLVAFEECLFFKRISNNYVYVLSQGRIFNAIETNFEEKSTKQTDKTGQTQKNHNGLSGEQWEFLKVISTALNTGQIDPRNKNESGIYYIKPIPSDDNTSIIRINGLREQFWLAHQRELSISMKLFFEIVGTKYLERAAHDNFYLIEDKIHEGVKEYYSNQEVNSIFGQVINLPQLQCDVFMVMPFREHLNPVYNNHIKPFVKNLGYDIKRGDDPFSHHEIMTEIWSLINNSKLIIADCTERNPNVFYELGIAHTLGKPAIMISQSVEDIPFDVSGKRAIIYKYTPEGIEQLKEDLRKAIQSILA